MNHKNFVICDRESLYMEHLVSVLGDKKDFPYQIHCFTTAVQLAAFHKEHTIDVLLVEEEQKEETEGWCALEHTFVLVKFRKETSGSHEVYKYQSADAIMEQIITIAGKEGSTLFSLGVKSDSRLIGVYSPANLSEKSSFALEMSKAYAKKQGALYLNLEPYAFIEGGYYGEDSKKTLSDMLYYAGQEGNFGARISTIIRQMGCLDYVLPCPVSLDLKEVSAKEWCALIQRLLEESIYDRIILDLSDCIQGLYEVLELCSKIYVTVSSQMYATKKTAIWERELQLIGKEALLEKVIKIPVIECTKERALELTEEEQYDIT